MCRWTNGPFPKETEANASDMLLWGTRKWGLRVSPVPKPRPKIGKRGLVTLAKIPVCVVSAVFVWSRGITFVYYQLLNS